mgnify:CR=1 FL=1
MKKSINSCLTVLAGMMFGAGTAAKVMNKSLKKSKDMSYKHLELFIMMNQWVKVKQEGKNLASYLEKNGYRKIAIYGMSYAGETLLNELQDSDVVVLYGIDKNVNSVCADIKLVSPEDKFDLVDAIVVSAITYFDEIEEKLSDKVECPIISLEDILYEI